MTRVLEHHADRMHGLCRHGEPYGDCDVVGPEVVTLCGSTRFKDAFLAEQARLTLLGKLVISVGLFGHVDMPDYDWTTDGSDLKRMLDRLHFAKIDLSDSIHVINLGGYVGESTRREIDYALRTGKRATYLENPR